MIMENNISVSLRDWEEKVRDQRSLEILSGLLNVDGYISVDHVRVILGLQVDKTPNVQPTEPAIWIDELVDPEELPEVSEPEAPDPHIGIPDSIPHSDATPPKGNSAKKNIDKGKVMALYKADWTMTKIADEMGCSVSNISRIIKEEM